MRWHNTSYNGTVYMTGTGYTSTIVLWSTLVVTNQRAGVLEEPCYQDGSGLPLTPGSGDRKLTRNLKRRYNEIHNVAGNVEVRRWKN